MAGEPSAAAAANMDQIEEAEDEAQRTNGILLSLL